MIDPLTIVDVILWGIIAALAFRNAYLADRLYTATEALEEFEAIAERIASEEARRIQ